MMKKLKFNKKSYLVIIYTFISLCSISLITNSTTNSFFKKTEDNVLAYTSELSKVYYGSFTPTFSNGSNETKALLSFTFNKDTRYGDAEQYIIKGFKTNDEKENSICNIKEVSSNLNLSKDTVTFKNNQTGTVTLECSVTPNERVDYTVKIYEKVTEEEDKFLYQMGFNGMEYSDYYSKFVEIPSDIIINKNDENIYEKFLNLAVNHAMNSEYFRKYECSTGTDEEVRTCLAGKIKGYFMPNENNPSIYDLTAANAKDKLVMDNFEMLGVTRVDVKDENDTTTGYGFLFDNDFLGYLKTNNHYKGLAEQKRIYFSNDIDLRAALENSIKIWTYPRENYAYGDVSILISYINQYLVDNNKEYIFDNLKSITTIFTGSNDTNYPYIYLRANAMDYAYNYLHKNDKAIRVSYSNNPYVISNVINNGIENIYGTSDIANYLKNTLNICIPTAENPCSNSEELLYSNGIYYKVTVTYYDKYSEIKITESTNLTNLYPSDSLYQEIDKYLTITDEYKDGERLNNAITCSDNCSEYSEILYNTDNTNNLLINIVLDNTYHVNKINISTTNTDVTSAIISLYNISSLGLSKLDENINANTEYYEIHSNESNILLFEVTKNDTNNEIIAAYKNKVIISNITNNDTISNLVEISKTDSVDLSYYVLDVDVLESTISVLSTNIPNSIIIDYDKFDYQETTYDEITYYVGTFTIGPNPEIEP